MIDLPKGLVCSLFAVNHYNETVGGGVLISADSFTRSNGTVVSRLYERLTKASRRRENNLPRRMREIYYRRGVYDAYKALQEELS